MFASYQRVDVQVRLEAGHVRMRSALEGVGRGVSNDSPCAVSMLSAKVFSRPLASFFFSLPQFNYDIINGVCSHTHLGLWQWHY